MERGSCNAYDYVCGDPVNGRDVDGRRGTKPLPNRDKECLGGDEGQLNSSDCRRYQQAKITVDSDYYYKGKSLSQPGRPNAFLKSTGDAIKPYLVYRPEVFAEAAGGCLSGAGAGLKAAEYLAPRAGPYAPEVTLVLTGGGCVAGAVGARNALDFFGPTNPNGL